MANIKPEETRPSRMSPLSALPVFVDLRGRRAVVAGDGDAAVWKAELLAAAGACVEVYASGLSDELIALQKAPPSGCVALIERRWSDADLTGAWLAVGALEGPEAEAFAAAARRHGVPSNIVDTPGLGTFSFGTIVNRSPVVIGIATDGAAPVLGQSIRSKIEAMLHPALGAWAAAAKSIRDAVKTRYAMGPARRELWRRFAAAALSANRAPTDDDIGTMLGAAPKAEGSVALVGAGPGDPELLTLKALRLLQDADIILYDRLVSKEVLELARREAKRMLVGKTGGGAQCRQDDINELMVRLARDGKRVIRLKGGDPMIFGRAAEEIAACRTAGIRVEVVPGITAALGAAAELQIPLTDRRLARRVELVTGHSQAGVAPEHDWPSLADPWSTKIFYMGARTFSEMLPKLLAAGFDPETPALAITAATTPRSRTAIARVADLPAVLAGLQSGEPCLIMVGRAIDLAGGIESQDSGRRVKSTDAA